MYKSNHKNVTMITNLPLFIKVYLTQTPMQMDLKPGGQELISKVSDLTKKYKREHLTIWGAFSHVTTVACRTHNPNILSFCSMWECSLYPLLMLLGMDKDHFSILLFSTL